MMVREWDGLVLVKEDSALPSPNDLCMNMLLL